MSLSSNVLFESPAKERLAVRNFPLTMKGLLIGTIFFTFLELLEAPTKFHENIFTLLYIVLGIFLYILLMITLEIYTIRIEGRKIHKTYLIHKWKNKVIHFDDIQTIEFQPIWVTGERNQLLIYSKKGRIVELEVQAEEVYIPLLRTINQINIPFYIREKPGRKKFEEDRKKILHSIKISGVQYNDYLYSSFLLAYPEP